MGSRSDAPCSKSRVSKRFIEYIERIQEELQMVKDKAEAQQTTSSDNSDSEEGYQVDEEDMKLTPQQLAEKMALAGKAANGIV